LKTLYQFSKRPETDDNKSKAHHEYNPWYSPQDFHGYNMRDAKEQMSEIKVLGSSRANKTGRHCLPFDFFTIQYEGYMQEGSNMMKVLDSKKGNDGKAITFQQGHFHVVKCWDLAVILLHAGEKIRISCPAYLSNGGAEAYSQMDSKKIPSDTPLTYELEILECKDKFTDLSAAGKAHFHKKTEGNVVDSGL
jgi:FKBP-type peptidyl-prolyl cis-trans isomerase